MLEKNQYTDVSRNSNRNLIESTFPYYSIILVITKCISTYNIFLESFTLGLSYLCVRQLNLIPLKKNGAVAVRKMEKSIDSVTSLLFTVRGEALLIISIILLAVSFYGFKSIVCLRNH